MIKYYTRVGKAADLEKRSERILFRLLEMLPGILAWGSIIAVILLSWLKPLWVAIFIIIYVAYWLFRTIYFSFHLRAGFKQIRANEKKDWISALNDLSPDDYQLPIKHWKELYHLIVFPMCKEPIEVVRDTFNALVKSDYPKENMIVVLSYEERIGESAKNIAQTIEKEFGSNFFRFMITCHPANLSGEMIGKGSNETWGVKESKKHIIDPLGISYEKIIFSAFDVDTVVFPRYFACLTHRFLITPNPTRTSYQPVALFINNIWQAPAISRVFSFSSTFWHTINQERPERLITFSSHSMSFQALVDVGFKQTNNISDDSRIFWQCLLHYDGDYRTQPLYFSVSMDAVVAKTLPKTLVHMYKQQLRWAWGVGEIPYAFFGFLKNKKIALRRKIGLGLEILEGHWSWATASILIFLLGWLPLYLGGPEFNQTIMAYSLPRITSRILTIAMLGLISSAYCSILLLPPRPLQYGKYKYIILILQWAFIPIMMIFFTSLPSLDAQTRWMFGRYMEFWNTPKQR